MAAVEHDEGTTFPDELKAVVVQLPKLDKQGEATKGFRPIGLQTIWSSIWWSTRFRQCKNWMALTMPMQLHGGLPHRDTYAA